MHEKVKKAQKMVDVIMYLYIGLSILLILSFFIQYGISEGIYRLITLGIGTTTAMALFNSIKEGSIGARIFQGSLSVIAAILGLYFIIKTRSEIGVLVAALLIILCLYFLFSGVYKLFSPQVILIRKYYKKYNDLKWLFNWKGICIGYLEDGFLWNTDGAVIGKFVDNEIYSPEGKYLGELYKNNNRLCIDKDKIDKSIEAFEVNELHDKFNARQNSSTLKLYNQYEDFNVVG